MEIFERTNNLTYLIDVILVMRLAECQAGASPNRNIGTGTLSSILHFFRIKYVFSLITKLHVFFFSPLRTRTNYSGNNQTYTRS